MNERTQLQDATARLAAIVEGSEDAIIGYRLDGVITDWNQAATRLYGYSAEEAIGHNVSILEPPSRQTSTQRSEVPSLLADESSRLKGFVNGRDGSLVEVSSSIFPITGQDGTIIGGSSIVQRHHQPQTNGGETAAKRRAIPVGGAGYQGCYLGLGH